MTGLGKDYRQSFGVRKLKRSIAQRIVDAIADGIGLLFVILVAPIMMLAVGPEKDED